MSDTGLANIQEGKNPIQKKVTDTLEKKGHGVDKILDNVIGISKNAMKSDKEQGMIPDNKARMGANKLLLELAGVSPKGGNINVNVGFASKIYNDKHGRDADGDATIDAGSVTQ